MNALQERLNLREAELPVAQERLVLQDTDLQRRTEGHRRAVGALQAEIAAGQRRERDARMELDRITGSTGWALLQRLRALRLLLAPRGTRRERTFLRLLRGLESRRGHGGRVAGVLPHSSTYDIMCFPVIDWEFRFQRPQQLLSRFASRGPSDPLSPHAAGCPGPAEPRLEPITDTVYGLALPGPPVVDICIATSSTGSSSIPWCRRSMDPVALPGIDEAICLVQLPFWAPLAFALRQRFGWRVIYDCLDDHAGFPSSGGRWRDWRSSSSGRAT